MDRFGSVVVPVANIHRNVRIVGVSVQKTREA